MSNSYDDVGLLDRLKCRLLGHQWQHKPNAVPEDRESFCCSRCTEWGFNPAMVGEEYVPEEYVSTGEE